MAVAEINVVDHVKTARRVAQRFAVKVDQGLMDRDDLDLVKVLFGQMAIEDRLEKYGLLGDPELGLDELADRAADGLLFVLEQYMGDETIDAMAGHLAKRFAAVRAKGSERDFPENFVRRGSGKRTAESEKAIARADAAAARIAAVHLAQRALYVGLSRALLKLATDQAKQVEGRLCGHGVLKFGDVKEAISDKVIEKMRRRSP